MTEKQFHALIEQQDQNRKAAARRALENKINLKEQENNVKEASQQQKAQ